MFLIYISHWDTAYYNILAFLIKVFIHITSINKNPYLEPPGVTFYRRLVKQQDLSLSHGTFAV